MTIRVLLVDDHPLVIDGLRAALAQADDIEIAGTASSVAGARAALEHEIDVVVCDVRLPDGSGFHLLKELRWSPGRRPAFLMLSSFDSAQYVDAATRLGASGFLLKTAPSEEMGEAIREVHRGKTHFSTASQDPDRRTVAFSARDRQLIAAVVRGDSNDQIAADLGVSRKTIEAQLSHLYTRSGVSTRTELAVAAERGGWLDLP